jgi:hypothetical protein
MTRQCTQCASLLEDGATVCAHCGVPAAEPASPAVAENFVSEAVSGQTIEPLAAPIDSPAQPPIKPPVFSSGDDLDGIGGWLLLSAFGLAFAPFLIAHNVYGDLKVLFGARYQPGLSIHPGLAGMVMFEAVTNSLFLAAVLALNYLLYNRKKVFSRMHDRLFHRADCLGAGRSPDGHALLAEVRLDDAPEESAGRCPLDSVLPAIAPGRTHLRERVTPGLQAEF